MNKKAINRLTKYAVILMALGLTAMFGYVAWMVVTF